MTKTADVLLNKLPGIFRLDFKRKVFALILTSIVFWAAYHNNRVKQNFQGVPVKITLPHDYTLLDSRNKTFTVALDVRGNERLLRGLGGSSFEVEIKPPVAQLQPGMPYQAALTPSDARGPMGIQIVELFPKSITIRADKVITRPLTVEPAFDPNSPLPKDYAIRSAVVKTVVTATAPSTEFEQIGTLKTYPIKLENMTQSFEYYAKVVPKPGVTFSPEEVLVQVEIEKAIEDRTFRGLRLKILGSEKTNRFKVELPENVTVDVVISGPRKQIDSVKPEQIKVYVDAGDLDEPGVSTLEIGCWVDPNELNAKNELNVKSVSPRKTKVKLTR